MQINKTTNKNKILKKKKKPNQPRGPIFLVSDRELGCKSNPSLLQENPQAHDTSPLLFWVSHQGCRSQSDCFSSLPARLQNCFLYRLGCRRAYLPRVAPQGVVFLTCSWWGVGTGKLSTLLLCHLDLPQRKEFLFQMRAGVPGFGLLIYVGTARILACQACLKSALPTKSHIIRRAVKGTSFCLEASVRGLKVDF